MMQGLAQGFSMFPYYHFGQNPPFVLGGSSHFVSGHRITPNFFFREKGHLEGETTRPLSDVGTKSITMLKHFNKWDDPPSSYVH